MPHGYWKDPQNQRNFLEKLGKKLKVKEPRDWGKITTQQVKENGGNSLLRMGTLFSALKRNYPGK